jgi:N-acetylmuramoyl-L-alanine amidase
MGGAGYLTGMKVAVDVQHLYRVNHPRDQGSEYVMSDGSRLTEAHCTLIYAAALHDFLIGSGAEVLSNNPASRTLVGYYSERNRAAGLWGADLYLACHLNSGDGSYAAVEMMAAHRDDRLEAFVGLELVSGFPEILESRAVQLAHGERGAVCIEACACPAAILEPFFGDNPRQQGLMSAGRLSEVGQSIGRGVGNWWRGKPPVA